MADGQVSVPTTVELTLPDGSKAALTPAQIAEKLKASETARLNFEGKWKTTLDAFKTATPDALRKFYIETGMSEADADAAIARQEELRKRATAPDPDDDDSDDDTEETDGDDTNNTRRNGQPAPSLAGRVGIAQLEPGLQRTLSHALTVGAEAAKLVARDNKATIRKAVESDAAVGLFFKRMTKEQQDALVARVESNPVVAQFVENPSQLVNQRALYTATQDAFTLCKGFYGTPDKVNPQAAEPADADDDVPDEEIIKKAMAAKTSAGAVMGDRRAAKEQLAAVANRIDRLEKRRR